VERAGTGPMTVEGIRSLEWSLKDLGCKVTMKDLDKRRRTDLKDVWYEIGERGDLFVWNACGLEDWNW